MAALVRESNIQLLKYLLDIRMTRKSIYNIISVNFLVSKELCRGPEVSQITTGDTIHMTSHDVERFTAMYIE